MNSFQPPEVLFVLAEISVNVVGFTGIVVALRFTDSEWSNAQKMRFMALVRPSLAALAACFFPQLASYFWVESSDIWRVSNLGIAILHLTSIVPYHVMMFRTDSALAVPFDWFGTLVGLTIIVMNLLAAANLIPFLEAVFVIAVMQQILVGISSFVASLQSPRGA